MRSLPAAEDVLNSNKIMAFQKAAGRITASCLFVLALLFTFTLTTHAAEVTKKTSNLIGNPQVANNKVTFSLSGTVKYVQHAKYLSSDYRSPVDIGITRTSSGRITGFAYKCPGYYTTRIYSDSRGQSLIGYIQTYVSTRDINNSGCEAISKPPGSPPTGDEARPPIPPAPKSETHPVPEVEVKKTVRPSTTHTPKKAAAVTQPPILTFDQYCVQNGNESNYRYKKIPGAENMPMGDDCCPVSKIDNTQPGTVFKVIYVQSGLDYSIAKGPYSGNTGWACANYHGPESDTYCPADHTYNATTDSCDEEEVEIEGDPGEWSPYPEDYEPMVMMADFSDFGEYSLPTDPEDPTEPTDPENPESPEDEKPACYCEEMGDWGYMCCIFECPGWEEYLGFLSGTIVGSASAPPVPDLPAPDIPNIFDVLNDVDERHPMKPTGTEDPNLGTSSFDENDIKNNAPEIEFREDPTGGFDIVNPLETLPEDGSTAPRPQEELETLPYPNGSSENTSGGTTPNPSNSGGSSGEVDYPTKPEGSAKPPTTGGTATPPTTGGSVKYPGT